jgi:isoleucyl-tRNA synthetase
VNGVKRRAAQTVLYQTLTALCGIMAPIASFLAEETYGYLPGEKKESVFLTDYPVAPKEWSNPKIEGDFAVLLEVRAAAQKVMEDLRREKIIGSSLDASLSISAPESTVKVLEAYRPSLREFFMVSQFEIKTGKDLQVQAGKATGEKCERCWHYDQLGTNKDMPTLCPKCVEALT